MGNNQRNVGNYTTSIKDALMQVGGMPPALAKATTASNAFNASLLSKSYYVNRSIDCYVG